MRKSRLGLIAASWCLLASPARAQDEQPSGSPKVQPPAPVQEQPAAPAQPEAKPAEGKFEFGSYGRVWIASDARGGIGHGSNVVAYGSRLVDEDSYAELELRREDTFKNDIKTRVVTTMALFPPFFHFSGKVDQAIAVRNLYAQGQWGRYTLWAGARMYRGDDIYLLNWWPLDNQNTVGGGFGVKFDDRGDTQLALHVGMQRLDNPYQFQKIPVVAPIGNGSVDIVKLDRPRTVESLKFTHLLRRDEGSSGLKLIGYAELHQLAAGVARDTNTNQDKGLPGDSGFLIGTQLTYFTGHRDTYASIVLRHARGLAAYDPLAVPTTFANDKTAGSAETTIAISGNWESEMLGLLWGGYLRFFRDGDPSITSTQKYDEGTLVVRPQLFLHDNWGIAVEGSYQARRMQFLDPNTDEPLSASVTRFGVMPYFSPAGRGSFKRPIIRALYAASFRNAGTRALFPVEDVIGQRKVDHFIGLGAEWWFNSSSYP